METIDVPLRGTVNVEDYLDDIPELWTKAKPDDLPDLLLLTKNKSKTEISSVTIYVWGLGSVGITVIIQCIEKERSCNITIDANARSFSTSTQPIERTIRDLLEEYVGMN